MRYDYKPRRLYAQKKEICLFQPSIRPVVSYPIYVVLSSENGSFCRSEFFESGRCSRLRAGDRFFGGLVGEAKGVLRGVGRKVFRELLYERLHVVRGFERDCRFRALQNFMRKFKDLEIKL